MVSNGRWGALAITFVVLSFASVGRATPEGRVLVQSLGPVLLRERASVDVAPVRLLVSTPAAYGDGFALWVTRDDRLPPEVMVRLDVAGISVDVHPRPFLANSVELTHGAQALAWNLPGGLHELPIELTIHVRKLDDSLIAAGEYPLRFFVLQANPVKIDVSDVFGSWDELFRGLEPHRTDGGAP